VRAGRAATRLRGVTTPSPTGPRRRTLLRAAAAAGTLAALAACTSAPVPLATAGRPRLRLLAEGLLPQRLSFQGTTVGGLSGLDFDPGSGRWAALSDDRSELQPARFYTLRLEVTPGRPLVPELLDAVTLRTAAGAPFPPRGAGGEVVDPEALRLLPGGGGLLWTSEGDRRDGDPPSLREARLDGSHVRDFALPAMFSSAAEGTGPRNNLGFEGLALTPDATAAWVAMEGPLVQDGAPPAVGDAGGPCRFTRIELATGRATRQIAYLCDPIPRAPAVPRGFADNGVSEVLMLDAHRMLVLERAFMLGVGMSLRLYEIDTRAGSDTLAQDTLRPGAYTPVGKQLVADFATLGLARLDNTESLAWGPRLRSGSRSLVVVSDDNFNPLQVTQFAAFEYLE
jgi:hypothetical protein